MTPVDDNEALQIGPDPDKLFVYHRQQLSAMLDGELSPDQAKFMLRRLQHDGELAACWERWQVCGDVLRGQRNDLLPGDFARRVALAVAGDAEASAQAQSEARAARPRFARWGGGAAIAASVALLAVFASRQLPTPGAPAEAPVPLVAEASTPMPSTPTLPAELPVAVADDAMADAAQQSPALPDAAAAVAASAVAVAQVPQRTTERRSRAQSQRVASRVQSLREAALPPQQVAVNAAPPMIQLPDELPSASDHFAMPDNAVARPWPRSLLSSSSTYAVAGGRLAPREPEFAPFLPADRAVLAAPAAPESVTADATP